jgi:flagellar hook-associated protein 3 FlgL
MDAFKGSLNSVNDRLRIEESYIEGAKDVLIRMKQLTLQGANATVSAKDREVLALELDELTSEMRNLANGTDANGNFLFAGSRVTTQPYQEDADGVIRYQGDTFESGLDYTANRRSTIGRTGLDVFKSVLSGNEIPAVPAVYSVKSAGTLEFGDLYQIEVDGLRFEQAVEPGMTESEFMSGLVSQINAAVEAGTLNNLEASVIDGGLQLRATDGVSRHIQVATANASTPVDDLQTNQTVSSESGVNQLSVGGTLETGDALKLRIGSREFQYTITGNEGETSPPTPSDVMRAVVDAVAASGLFTQSAEVTIDSSDPSRLNVRPLRESIGVVEWTAVDRTAVDNQALQVTLVQEPTPALPERVDFFESLQEVAHVMRHGSQEDIQAKLGHLDQMLDIVTLSLADIGSEMSSIRDEIDINEDLKLQLETTLSSQEDLDFTSAITELQAKMMSLEAAQSSFAKISQLSVFDYLR